MRFVGPIIIALLLLGTALIAGCLSEEEDDAGTSVTITTGEQRIELLDKKVILDVKEGSVDEDIEVHIEEASDTTLNSGIIPGTIIDLGPDGTQFKKPITLTVHYDEAVIPQGVNRSELFLCYLQDGVWSPVKLTQSLPTENAVKGEISGFSTYAVWTLIWGSDADVILKGSSSRYQVHDLSGNGRVAVGQYVNSEGNSEAFRWTKEGELHGLGFAGTDSSTSYATCVNSDGSIIAGNIDTGKLGAFVWTGEKGMRMLTAMWKWSRMAASDVSSDGNMVVGSITNDGYGHESGFVMKDPREGIEIDYLPSESHASGEHIGNDGVIYGSGWYQNDENDREYGDIKWTRNGDEYELHPSLSFFHDIEPSLSQFPEGTKDFSINDANKNHSFCVGKFQDKNRKYVGFIYDKTHGVRTMYQYLLEIGMDPTALGFWTSIIPESVSASGDRIACNLVREVPNYGPTTYSSVVFTV